MRTAVRSAVLLGIAVVLAGAAPSPDIIELVEAARQGNAQAVRSLLDQGADVNAARGDGMTALHRAAERGHAEVAELLIAASANVEAKTRIGSYTPLHLGSRGGHAAIIVMLLEAGGNPNAVTTNSGVTPLHLAAAAIEGAEAVAALLGHGADPNARARTGQTPLIFAAGSNRAPSVRELLKGGANPGARTKVIDVLPSLALDREATKRFRERLFGTELAEAMAKPRSRIKAPDVELSSTEVQAAIRAQRELLLSGYDVGDVDTHSLARVRPD